MNMNQKPFSIYIHWPYCLSKCPYCDFASCPTSFIDEKNLWSGYNRDILSLPEGRPVHSIFFGGGTPSLMSSDLCFQLLDLIRSRHPIEKNCEITMEANPDAISLSKMQDFLKAGVNRLSIGVQSLREKDLRFLGRRHTKETAIYRVLEAKEIFPEINMDLIYARPNQTPDEWKTELEEALSLGLTHYSLYQLSIEPETPFEKKGIMPANEETATLLYCLTDDIMTKSGIPAYEVSNYAVKGHECQHNLAYWRTNDYAAVGPAAHGRIDMWAIQNPVNVSEWLQKGGSKTKLSKKEKQTERIMMGIRLRQEGCLIDDISQQAMNEAILRHWAYKQKEKLIPTRDGILMLNQLILLLMP